MSITREETLEEMVNRLTVDPETLESLRKEAKTKTVNELLEQLLKPVRERAGQSTLATDLDEGLKRALEVASSLHELMKDVALVLESRKRASS